MIRSVLRGKRAHCSNGELIRDFLHVQDVAGAFTALLDSGVNGAVNIGSGQPVAIKDVVDRISGKAGRRDLIEFGVIPSDKGTSDSLVADIRRMSDEVGWSPTYDLDRGLEQTISWWRGRLVKECEESVA
jgi:nucleoside-diphosphate-sugar epimerase